MKDEKEFLGGDERPQRAQEPAPVAADAASHAETLRKNAAANRRIVAEAKQGLDPWEQMQVTHSEFLLAQADAMDVGAAAIEACIKTVAENGYLADGENCTLIDLKRAIRVR